MSGAVAQGIEIFNMVRERPFRFDLINAKDDWSFRSKARDLTQRLNAIGIAARQICYGFSWTELPLPPQLLVTTPMPYSQAWCVEIEDSDGKKIKIDPSWDSPLAPMLPTAKWNGSNSTTLAIEPFRIFDAEASANIWNVQEGISMRTRVKFVKQYGHFYNELNQWIASLRRPLAGPHA